MAADGAAGYSEGEDGMKVASSMASGSSGGALAGAVEDGSRPIDTTKAPGMGEIRAARVEGGQDGSSPPLGPSDRAQITESGAW